MAMRCDVCGLESSLTEAFQRRRRLFRRSQRLCPGCAFAGQSRELAQGIGSSVILGLGSGVALVLLDDHPVGWLALNALLLFGLEVLTNPLHEAGHALAGRALGLRVLGVVLGQGGLLRRFELLGLPVELRRVPFGGVTHLVPGLESDDDTRLAPRIALATLAGPAVHAALLGVAFVGLGGVPGPSAAWSALSTGLDPWLVLALASALALAANLVPHTVKTAIGPLDNDGRQFLQALRAGPEVQRAWLLMRYSAPASFAWLRGDYAEARRHVEAGLARFPGDATLRGLLALVLTEEGELERAREIYLSLLTPELDAPTRAVQLNNLAYGDFLLERDDLLDEAERCSEEAIGILPWMPAIQGTRGAVLVWAERTDEGLDWLARALSGVERPRDRALVLATLALGQAQCGRAVEAKRNAELARASDPACRLLGRVTRALDAARQP